jgi:ribosomal protein S18 acetylase RimI-like enzyme
MSKNNIEVRVATLQDADQISSVLLDFYNMRNIDEAKNAFLSEMKKDFHYLVASLEDSIIGIVTWLPHGLPKHGLFELDRICILSESRGKGVGKLLVDELIKHADAWYKMMKYEKRKLYILTHENNINAHSFYEKIGFSHETSLKDHYYENQNERVYSKFFEIDEK